MDRDDYEDEEDDYRPRGSVCPHCAGENAENATICRHCMGPLMGMQNTDPVGSIMVRGDVFAKAARTPTKPIVLIGIWLIFGPSAMFLTGALAIEIARVKSGDGGVCSMVPTALFDALAIAILTKTTRNFFRFRRKESEKKKRGFEVVGVRERED